jgi:hypothetical protein
MDDGVDGAGTADAAGSSGHARFERNALAHVLGGLGRPDSDAFRSHLRTCADCRARVAELRGISSTLDAAAREERRRAATAVAAPPEAAPARRPRTEDAAASRSRRLGLFALALAVVVGVGFWNLHLRTQATTYYEVASERGDILRDLAAGDLVEDPALVAAQARVAVTPTRVVVLLADAGPLADGERLVAWLLPEGATAEGPRVLAAGPADGGELAVRLPRGTATALVVSREVGPIGAAPAGAEVLRVGLPAGLPGA